MILMPLRIPFATVGSIVVTGFEQSLQGTIARCCAVKIMQAGRSVVFLCNHPQEISELQGAMADLLRGLETDLKLLDRVHIVKDVNAHRTVEALGAVIRLESGGERPTLIIRDASHEMIPINLDQWLPLSDELALLLDTPVLTVTHHGPAGPPAPRYSDIPADEVWTTSPGLNLALTLKRIKPREETVRLRGHVLHGGQYAFENEAVKSLSEA